MMRVRAPSRGVFHISRSFFISKNKSTQFKYTAENTALKYPPWVPTNALLTLDNDKWGNTFEFDK